MIKVDFNPHDSQVVLMENELRFTVLNSGRRWGKTLYALFKILWLLSLGKRIAYFAPTTKRFSNVWDKLANILASNPLAKVNHSNHYVKIESNGALCHFWTLEDIEAGRSEYYDYVVIDEAAYASNLEYTWNNSIRPTLVDTQGWALFMSTPNGSNNFFYDLAHRTGDDWYYHCAPTHTNTYLPKEELEAIKRDTPEQVFRQEYEAEFIDSNEDAFFYSKGSIVWSNIIKPKIDVPLHLSFDFNVNPCSMLVSQKIDLPRVFGGGLYTYKELQVPGTTHELCEIFKSTEYWKHPAGFVVTGDSAGSSFDTTADVLHNNYDIIRHDLSLSEFDFRNTRERNPLHEWSRRVCNTVFHNQLWHIHPECKVLKQELDKAIPTRVGKLKKDRDKHKNDLVDALRYQANMWFPQGTPEIRDFKAFINQAA